MLLRRRVAVLVAAASIAVMMLVAMAMPTFADEGGVPNERACHGQVVKTENQIGTTPHEGVAQLGLNNAGELNKGVKSGVIISEQPNAPNCPLGGF
jgi:hypothetical protein